jgi:hypothetical protein
MTLDRFGQHIKAGDLSVVVLVRMLGTLMFPRFSRHAEAGGGAVDIHVGKGSERGSHTRSRCMEVWRNDLIWMYKGMDALEETGMRAHFVHLAATTQRLRLCMSTTCTNWPSHEWLG